MINLFTGFITFVFLALGVTVVLIVGTLIAAAILAFGWIVVLIVAAIIGAMYITGWWLNDA